MLKKLYELSIMTNPLIEAQFAAIITPLEKYENEFPTVIELLRVLRIELNENDFNILKSLMITAIYERFEVKTDYLNCASESSKQLDPIQIYKEFRIFTARTNSLELRSNSQHQMNEMLNIFGDSFTLRDLRNRFLDGDDEYITNNDGLNTVQFYRQLNKVAKNIDAIQYED